MGRSGAINNVLTRLCLCRFSVEGGDSSRRSGLGVETLETHVTGDLLWAFFKSDITGEMFDSSVLPEEHYPVLARDDDTKYFVRELPYSFDFLVENFMDPAHIPFAHHSLQGVRTDGSPIDMAVVANNFTHCEVSFKDVIRGKEREGVVSMQRPCYYHFRTKGDSGGFSENLKIFIAPVAHGRCRVMFGSPLSIGFLPTWLVHAASNRFLNTDAWLHDAERFARREGGKLKYKVRGKDERMSESTALTLQIRPPLGAHHLGHGPDGLPPVVGEAGDGGSPPAHVRTRPVLGPSSAVEEAADRRVGGPLQALQRVQGGLEEAQEAAEAGDGGGCLGDSSWLKDKGALGRGSWYSPRLVRPPRELIR